MAKTVSQSIREMEAAFESLAYVEDKLRRFIRRETDADTKQKAKWELADISAVLDNAEKRLKRLRARASSVNTGSNDTREATIFGGQNL